uniref:E3 ubiquitin-protein ligase NEURL3-like n=1 Tax=Paramormyrops kingsleyae TaxID=1676925 RepID=A0A3B3RYY8_9TELE|nr:E3 ubiquitin-protein ligase NEURL3-like isoform X1 [Paramormyrops kingsleyae]
MPDRHHIRTRRDSSHCCSGRCLGPLSFYTGATGARVTLSLDARRAERVGNTFRDGLVFSSRPVRVQERVRLRVERSAPQWHGALRLGFTAVRPTYRTLPSFAIPHLTDTPGYWAGIVPEVCSHPGSELQFWVTPHGELKLKVLGTEKILLKGVDVRQPLWAMIDVYGQTSAVLLLGSKKKNLFSVQTSCPVPVPPPISSRDRMTSDINGNIFPSYTTLNLESLWPPTDPWYPISDNGHITGGSENCVVCLCQKSTVILRCGHQCLCLQCADRVFAIFRECPLCREPFTDLLDVSLAPS